MKVIVLSTLTLVGAVLVLSASASEQAKAPACQGSARGKSVGAGNVLHGSVYLGRAEKYGDGNRLYSGSVICTTNQGLFKFNVTLSSKGVACKVKSASSLELGPSGKWLINYRSDTSRCQVNGAGMNVAKDAYGHDSDARPIVQRHSGTDTHDDQRQTRKRSGLRKRRRQTSRRPGE